MIAFASLTVETALVETTLQHPQDGPSVAPRDTCLVPAHCLVPAITE